MLLKDSSAEGFFVLSLRRKLIASGRDVKYALEFFTGQKRQARVSVEGATCSSHMTITILRDFQH
jgi:hypothetical protein